MGSRNLGIELLPNPIEETRWSLVVVSVSAVGTLGEADADDGVRGFHWVLHQDEVAQHDVEDDQLVH